MTLIKYAYIFPTREAAEAYGAKELIKFRPEGYDTRVSVSFDERQPAPNHWRLAVERYNSCD